MEVRACEGDVMVTFVADDKPQYAIHLKDKILVLTLNQMLDLVDCIQKVLPEREL